MRMFLRVGSSNGVRKILGDFSSGVFAAFRLFSPRVLLFFFVADKIRHKQRLKSKMYGAADTKRDKVVIVNQS